MGAHFKRTYSDVKKDRDDLTDTYIKSQSS